MRTTMGSAGEAAGDTVSRTASRGGVEAEEDLTRAAIRSGGESSTAETYQQSCPRGRGLLAPSCDGEGRGGGDERRAGYGYQLDNSRGVAALFWVTGFAHRRQCSFC